MMAQKMGLWDVDHPRLDWSTQGDPLEKLAANVDFAEIWIVTAVSTTILRAWQ